MAQVLSPLRDGSFLQPHEGSPVKHRKRRSCRGTSLQVRKSSGTSREASVLWRWCAHQVNRDSQEELACQGRRPLRAIGRRQTLRAKGTLISEPRFSTPCEMRFFPTRERENGLSRVGFSLKRLFPLSRVGKIAPRRG